MTNPDERLFMLDLAIVQLIAGILVTLGSALLPTSIGFGLTIPAAVKDAISQSLMMMEISPQVQQDILQESLRNYVLLILASASAVLIVVGILYASIKTSRLRRQLRNACKAADLIAWDVKQDSVRVPKQGVQQVRQDPWSASSQSYKHFLNPE